MSRRQRGDRLALWNRDKEHQRAIVQLGRKIKAICEDGVTTSPQTALSLRYSAHEDSLKTGNSFAYSRHFVV